MVVLPKEVAQQVLAALASLGTDDDVGQASWDFAEAGEACFALRQAIEADTKPCACCGEGKAHLSVTRVCDTCGSEYAGQDEMDAAKRMKSEQQAEPVAVVGSDFQLLYTRLNWSEGLRVGDKLYTNSQPAQWVGLTDDDIDPDHPFIGSIRAIEAKLREKNACPQPEQQPLTMDHVHAMCRTAGETENHACAIAVWMTKQDAVADDADDKGVAGWLDEAENRIKSRCRMRIPSATPNAPAQQPLTDEQIDAMWQQSCREHFSGLQREIHLARAIEHAHSIK